MILQINKNQDFKTFISNLKALRSNYEEILTSFCYFQLHEKVVFIRQFKTEIYSLNFEEWKKNLIWQYLNNDELLITLQEIARRK